MYIKNSNGPMTVPWRTPDVVTTIQSSYFFKIIYLFIYNKK